MAVCIVAALNLSEDINYFFELKFPDSESNEAAHQFGILCIFIVVANYLIERAMKFVKYGKFFGYI